MRYASHFLSTAAFRSVKLSAGWESTITLAVEILFPSNRLLTCLDRFGQESPGTRIELIESVLGGTADALLSGHVDLAISPVPPGFLGDLLTQVRLIAVAHADHPLHHQPHELTYLIFGTIGILWCAIPASSVISGQ